jgi:retinol dehydrogenase-12
VTGLSQSRPHHLIVNHKPLKPIAASYVPYYIVTTHIAMPGIPRFLWSQLFYTPKLPPKDFFVGKTVIVTGANSGLGLEATRHFVRAGASTVIIACRTINKGEAAKRDIEETEGRTDVLQVWELDMASYASVKAFAKKCESLPQIDVLLQNAGLFTVKFELAEGHETTITVHVISTFMLAFLLLPLMKTSAAKTGTKPYISIVTSETHEWVTFPEKKSPRIFDALDDGKATNMMERYGVSKLLQVLAVRHLTKTLIEDSSRFPVIINLVTPGLCRTGLVTGVGIAPDVLNFFLGRTVEVGSRTYVNAVGPVGEASMGEYVLDDEICDPSPFVLSEEGSQLAKKVWEELVEILEEACPGITQGITQ